MKTGYLITARLKSTRLPEKLLREVQGRPIFAHLLDRVKQMQSADEIIVCTSTEAQDDRLEELARAEGVSCFRGDDEDVLQRLYDAAVAHGLDYILNITADCPLVDPEYADRVVAAYEETGADLVRALDLPHGAFSYGIKPEALAQVLQIKDDLRTEVWGYYFTHTDLFQVHDLEVDARHRRPGLRMTLDYPADLEFFEAVFGALYQPGEVFTLDAVLGYLDAHPETVEINRHCATAFSRRWKRQASISLKPRYGVKRAAILGCGSIGQRHIRNLRALGVTDLVALRSRQGHFQQLAPELGVREVSSWDALLREEPDIAVIANPTSLHLETASKLVPHVRGLFIEKPLAASLGGVAELLAVCEEHRPTTFVGYSLQFHPVARQMQALLTSGALGEPLVLQGQVGHWLPDWHPYEDHRQAYYARRDLGGGVMLTLIHEIHLAMQLLGPVRDVQCMLSEYAALDLDVDVIADLMLRHETSGVSQLHLDFVQRRYHRTGTISCERGWIDYDFAHPRVTVSDADGERTVYEAAEYDGNRSYIDMMTTFLGFVREGRVRHAYDVWEAAESLAVVDQAFASAGLA